jgi:hypothetical protein
MNVRARIVRGDIHDLGYWEGDPPAVGDTIDLHGPCMVEQRHWVSWFEVRLHVRRVNASWQYHDEWSNG